MKLQDSAEHHETVFRFYEIVCVISRGQLDLKVDMFQWKMSQLPRTPQLGSKDTLPLKTSISFLRLLRNMIFIWRKSVLISSKHDIWESIKISIKLDSLEPGNVDPWYQCVVDLGCEAAAPHFHKKHSHFGQASEESWSWLLGKLMRLDYG